MKATGIVRRIDDLGRIVIPKELRRNNDLKEGDPLEFYVENDIICLKKYCPDDSKELAEVCADIVKRYNSIIKNIIVANDTTTVVTTDNKVGTAKRYYKDLPNFNIGVAYALRNAGYAIATDELREFD